MLLALAENYLMLNGIAMLRSDYVKPEFEVIQHAEEVIEGGFVAL
ncbi:protein of unknown function [Shewanella benthica]|uniref:Uncharacterized protein n=1 Tax=Shewanella benthica TaxID=43661 RepID=A0A330M4W5_9GAMM|nr:hypothetical protein [Shewanella benthica]SQH77749.1 protein of unknown function [Shewanella benthica]